MSGLTSPKTYAVLAALQAGDAVACAIPLPPIARLLDDLDVPVSVRPVLPVVTAASAVGLLSVTRFPALARLTTAMLTLYFILAVGANTVKKFGHMSGCEIALLMRFRRRHS